MSEMCIVCAINTLKFKSGLAYVIGTLIGERGLQHLATSDCELHREAAAEIRKTYTDFADKYEKELLANDPT